ncbi:MAG TPA: bluetail domain-containing putative surface protein [Coleofasciculaceae cyanobacterium]|jgi:hypothetical protein
MADTDILKLTDATTNQASFVLYTTPVDATKGLSITFDFFSYGGSFGDSVTEGGDGIGFFFIDGSQSPTKPGGFGGSLGYAQRDGSVGIAGGYLGVGFDEFGFYSASEEGRIGGLGRIPDSIAVRGSQATGYKYLTGSPTSLPGSLDNPGPQATRDNSRRRAQVDLTPQGLLTVQIDLNGDKDFLDAGEQPITGFDVVGVGGNGALPTTFKFGFAGSTGTATNIHEVGNFEVKTSDGTLLSGSFTNSLLITGGNSGTPGGVLTGSTGGDTIIGGDGTTSTGDTGADRFVFAGISKASALKSSTVRKLSKVTDFKFSDGDRFQLDFDNNLNTAQRPKGLSYAGKVKARNLTEATKFAYADKSASKRGKQVLKKDEALFFKFGSRTYLSVNDAKAAFAPRLDLVADVTGIEFKAGDVKKASLAVGNYFV